MQFEQAVKAVRELTDAYCPGTRAIKRQYRDRIVCGDTRRLKGSVDLDSALGDCLPNEHRWDYGIGVEKVPHSDEVHWIEVHPAGEGEVTEMLLKHEWLKAWLSCHAPHMLRMTCDVKGYVWIATKSIGFRQGSPKAKLLQTQGISFPCKRFVVPL